MGKNGNNGNTIHFSELEGQEIKKAVDTTGLRGGIPQEIKKAVDTTGLRGGIPDNSVNSDYFQKINERMLLPDTFHGRA
jgi:hypothetical protein